MPVSVMGVRKHTRVTHKKCFLDWIALKIEIREKNSSIGVGARKSN